MQELEKNNLATFSSAKARALDGAIEIVNELAEDSSAFRVPLERGGWIPCSEELPEEEGTYWVTRENGEVDKEDFQIWSNGGSFRSDFQLPDENVIAWQPLPEKYKGE